MASASGIRAGAAFIELSVNDSKLIKGLRSALARLKSFGAGLENIGSGLQSIGTRLFAAGAGLTGALLASAKGFAEIGDQLDKMSLRTGVSVEALSELGYAAKQSGASLEDVEKGIRQMQRAIAEASSGLKTAQDALATLGLSAEQLIGLSPEQQFELIAQRLSQIENPTLRAAAAMEIFGRAGTSLCHWRNQPGLGSPVLHYALYYPTGTHAKRTGGCAYSMQSSEWFSHRCVSQWNGCPFSPTASQRLRCLQGWWGLGSSWRGSSLCYHTPSSEKRRPTAPKWKSINDSATAFRLT